MEVQVVVSVTLGGTVAVCELVQIQVWPVEARRDVVLVANPIEIWLEVAVMLGDVVM